MSRSKPIRNRIRDEELDAFFEEHKQDVSTKPWQKADWSEKREQILADNCEWCGGSENLNIHHEHEAPEWWQVWDEARDSLFESSDYYSPQRYDNTDEVCPNCSKKGFYHRSTMEPAYRCQQCDHEFDEPDDRPIPDEKHDSYWMDVNEFVKGERDKITEEFKQRYETHWDSYLSLENTVTICKSCHFAWHENNQRICARCNNTYARHRSEYNEFVCWDCVTEDKGLEQCPKCEDTWYNPEFNGLCKNCRVPLEGICPECRDYIGTNNTAVQRHLENSHDWGTDLARRATGPVETTSSGSGGKVGCTECGKNLRSERQLVSHLVEEHSWSRIEARRLVHN